MDIFYQNIDKSDGKTKREREYNAGRFLVEYAAKNFFNIENSEIEVVNNKPRFKYSDICFSISHSNGIAAVCFDKYPIGFDIEIIKERDYLPIAKRMGFKLKNNNLEEFYKCWTMFEAEYKLNEKACNIFTEKFLDKYMMSVASGKEEKIELKIMKVQ